MYRTRNVNESRRAGWPDAVNVKRARCPYLDPNFGSGFWFLIKQIGDDVNVYAFINAKSINILVGISIDYKYTVT